MPKQTFFNLPAEKRKWILNVAVKEFAEQGYKGANISRMVQEAGIAKGSFYQYFEDKDDLYLYIVTIIAGKKLAVYEREKGRLEDLSLTGFLRMISHQMFRDFTENPELLRIGADFVQLEGEPVHQKIMKLYPDITSSFYVPFIEHEIGQGEIPGKVNPHLLNFILISLGMYLSYYLKTTNAETIHEELIDQILDDMEYILKNGIYTDKGKSM